MIGEYWHFQDDEIPSWTNGDWVIAANFTLVLLATDLDDEEYIGPHKSLEEAINTHLAITL